jgi:dephospho-CoA kinase
VAELARREAAQWPLDRKRALADHVIRNDGDPASLRAQVRAVLDEVSSVRGGAGSAGPAS